MHATCNQQTPCFHLLQKMAEKHLSLSYWCVRGPSNLHQKCRGDPILLFGALDAAAVGPNKNGVVKGRGKRLGKKIWCPESFGTWTKAIMNIFALRKAFCLFKVIVYGFDPMGFITMKTHCFGECVWFTFSNHRTSISKKQNQDVLCVCHFFQPPNKHIQEAKSRHFMCLSCFPTTEQANLSSLIVYDHICFPWKTTFFGSWRLVHQPIDADENDFQAPHSSITSVGVTIEIHHATWVRTRVVVVWKICHVGRSRGGY